ncbi:MAG: AAA family ATPase [Thermoanaerobaculia bacterium]
MSASAMIRFDEAWDRANDFVRRHRELCRPETVLVRDLYGKIRLALDDREMPDRETRAPDAPRREKLAAELHAKLGAWSPGAGSILLLASRLFVPAEIFGTADALRANPEKLEEHDYKILDRSIIGADWLRQPFAPPPPERRRLTLFGIKGGVGRSTAAVVLAWRLAQRGHRTLVVDLDLESPGVGTTLLPADRAPDFGLVDWLVEDAVGQADAALLEAMVAPSPLGDGGSELWVVPAGGRSRDDYSYLPKLARAYAELGAGDEERVRPFGERLHDLICRLEEELRPEVVLLDSRAGLHDIAALSVTRMRATSLLFAVDSPQTWHAYRALFEVWRAHFDRAQGFRDNLKMVAAQIPETETRSYLESFRQQAYDLFLENLYEETPPGEMEEFNFAPNDADAPHVPLRIHWSRTFQQFDPVGQPEAITPQQITAAFGDFLRGVGFLLFDEDLS